MMGFRDWAVARILHKRGMTVTQISRRLVLSESRVVEYLEKDAIERIGISTIGKEEKP